MSGDLAAWWTQPVSIVLWGRLEPLLGRADHACKRLGDPNDDEALHDLRVTLRRLRALLCGYAPYVPGVGKKLPRRLRALMCRTSCARDAEVMRGWVESQRSILTAEESAGLDWLLCELSVERAEFYTTSRREIMSGWAKLGKKVRSRMEYVASAVPAEGGSYGEVSAVVMLDCCDDLERRVRKMVANGDVRNAHRMRIAAKRLLYLVEPYADTWPVAAALVDALGSVQDQLGALHDGACWIARLRDSVRVAAGECAAAHLDSVLAESATVSRESPHVLDPLPGLIALARLLRQRHDYSLAQVCCFAWEEWGDGLLKQVRTLAMALHSDSEKPIWR